MKHKNVQQIIAALLDTCGICGVLEAVADAHRSTHRGEASAISRLSQDIGDSRFDDELDDDEFDGDEAGEEEESP